MAARREMAAPSTPILRPLVIGEVDTVVVMGTFAYWITFGDGRPEVLKTGSWYTVSDEVALVRQRYVIIGKARPWRVAEPKDGLVFMHSRDASTQVRIGDKVRMETQELDRSGQPIELPTGRTGVPALHHQDRRRNG